MSDYVIMTVFGAIYDGVVAAEVDYKAVKALYYELGLMDTFDAAVIKKHEQPTRQGACHGPGGHFSYRCG